MTTILSPEEIFILAKMEQELAKENQKPDSERAQDMPKEKTGYLIGIADLQKKTK